MVGPLILTQEEWEVGWDMLPIPWDVYHYIIYIIFVVGLSSPSPLGSLWCWCWCFALPQFWVCWSLFLYVFLTLFFSNYAHYAAFLFLLSPKLALTWATQDCISAMTPDWSLTFVLTVWDLCYHPMPAIFHITFYFKLAGCSICTATFLSLWTEADLKQTWIILAWLLDNYWCSKNKAKIHSFWARQTNHQSGLSLDSEVQSQCFNLYQQKSELPGCKVFLLYICQDLSQKTLEDISWDVATCRSQPSDKPWQLPSAHLCHQSILNSHQVAAPWLLLGCSLAA